MRRLDERHVVDDEDAGLADTGEFLRRRVDAHRAIGAAVERPRAAEIAVPGAAARELDRRGGVERADEVFAPVAHEIARGPVGIEVVHEARRRTRAVAGHRTGHLAGGAVIVLRRGEQVGNGCLSLAAQHAIDGALAVAQEIFGDERRAVAADEDVAIRQQGLRRLGEIDDPRNVGEGVAGEREPLGPPGASGLLRLTRGGGFHRDQERFHRRAGKIDAFDLGEVREMQAVARHADPDRRLEVVDQLELRLGGRIGPGAAPHRADAEVDRGARVEMRDRVHAERERDVRAIVGRGADQRPGALECEQVVRHVLGGARIEERAAGGAARAPVLDHLCPRRDAKLVVEARGWNLAQRLLGEHRDAAPDLGLVHAVEIDRRHAPPPELRLQRALDREAFSFTMDAINVCWRLGPSEVHRRVRC